MTYLFYTFSSHLKWTGYTSQQNLHYTRSHIQHSHDYHTSNIENITPSTSKVTGSQLNKLTFHYWLISNTFVSHIVKNMILNKQNKINTDIYKIQIKISVTTQNSSNTVPKREMSINMFSTQQYLRADCCTREFQCNNLLKWNHKTPQTLPVRWKERDISDVIHTMRDTGK